MNLVNRDVETQGGQGASSLDSSFSLGCGRDQQQELRQAQEADMSSDDTGSSECKALGFNSKAVDAGS